jgi:hypothetical protein
MCLYVTVRDRGERYSGMLWPSCQCVVAGCGMYAPSSGPDHGGDSAAALSASRPGWAVAVRETCTRGSLRPHLIRAWL